MYCMPVMFVIAELANSKVMDVKMITDSRGLFHKAGSLS